MQQKFKTVDEYLESLDSDKRAQVDALRDIIIAAEPRLEEHIKWNAPSYVWQGEDRITCNTLNKEGVVKLVFHMGATRKEDKKADPVMDDESGLIEWSSDIRGMMTFRSLDDIESRREALSRIIKQWLSISAS